MKKMKYMLSLLLLLPFVSSCEKEIMDYEGVDGLYFDAQWDNNPNINTDTTKWIRQHYTLVNFAKEGSLSHSSFTFLHGRRSELFDLVSFKEETENFYLGPF